MCSFPRESLALLALAYADPSGGIFFQILMPLFAAAWGAWLIFANRIRHGIARVVRYIKGSLKADASENRPG